ncbi:helix-hairpin-helix domain-containing protein [Paenibacillus sp. N3/727]|uniref:ComEA family DNA-binding protein n=1 Tax=Paenibacillus sp. N3/727 TaxID=2925845 RepID=UPI001F53049D|nr:helix-hairpin-helix domain-containing protein [Paenibacillus sp. N3/727]UNK20016.1 helix-hairpin-helix domain-containing protein [Paenibacillus sp. N3/727]
MRRLPLGLSVTTVLLGCGLILFAGGNQGGIQGWKPLNAEIEEVLGMQEPDSLKSVPTKSVPMKEAVEKGNDDSNNVQRQQGVKETPVPASVESEDPAKPVIDASKPAAEDVQSAEKVSEMPAAETSGKININTADAAALIDLPGIGEKKAQAIIDYRIKHGPFRTAVDLLEVKGIGPKMLEKMKPYVGF